MRPPGAARPRPGTTAWRATQAPLIAFTDDDCEAEPEWLATILAAAVGNPGAVIQGPTHANPRELDQLGPFARTQRIETPNHWFQTCNIAYPRDLLERLDGFDERFTSAGEDVDLGWRATAPGPRCCGWRRPASTMP